MNNDSMTAQIYQGTYSNVKDDAELESKELKALHDKYDYVYDKERMKDKLPTEWYDLQELDDAEDVQYSTDFTDEENDLVYKRYKMQQYRMKKDLKGYQETIADLTSQVDEYKPLINEHHLEWTEKKGRRDSRPVTRDVHTLLAKAKEKKASTVKQNEFVMTAIAEMKYEKARRNRPYDLAQSPEGDPIFGDLFIQHHDEEEARNDTSLHPELRKMIYSTLPEG